MHVYIDFVSMSGVTSSCSISLNVGIVICIVSSVSVRPVNKIAKKKKKKNLYSYIGSFTCLYVYSDLSFNKLRAIPDNVFSGLGNLSAM